MKYWTDPAWRRATGAAALLFVAGGVTGVLVDRTLLSPASIHAAPLTADALAHRLGLSRADEARIRGLLDSLHTEMSMHVQLGPDALGAAARAAQGRIEAALPLDSRAEFRAWMKEHHDHLMGRMRGGHTAPTPRH
jgi:hypothetical protein